MVFISFLLLDIGFSAFLISFKKFIIITLTNSDLFFRIITYKENPFKAALFSINKSRLAAYTEMSGKSPVYIQA